MTSLLKQMEGKTRADRLEVSIDSVLLFENRHRTTLNLEDSCEELLYLLFSLIKAKPIFIRNTYGSLLEKFLTSFSNFKSVKSFGSGGIPRKVKFLPLANLNELLEEWVLSFDLHKDSTPLASTYALITAEFVNFCLGVERGYSKNWDSFRLDLFDGEKLRTFFRVQRDEGLSFQRNKGFKRAFTKQMSKSPLVGMAPPGCKVIAYRKTILSPGERFFFIPQRCYLSDTFGESFKERYVYKYFYCHDKEKTEYSFIDEPCIKGALVKKGSLRRKIVSADSIYVGDLPVRWLVDEHISVGEEASVFFEKIGRMELFKKQ